MKIILAMPLLLLACNSASETRIADCKAGVGEACNQMGRATSGADADAYFRRACDLSNTNGCVNLAIKIKTKNPTEAKRVLKYACDRGNTDACVKYAEILVEQNVR